MANVTVVGLAYARRNFKESSGPITAATTFASVACERPLIFIDAALGQMVKGTFRSAQGTREKKERGVWHPCTGASAGTLHRESSSLFEAKL